MSKQLTTAQFTTLCKQYGKDKFMRRPVDIRPGRKPLTNKQLKDIIAWLNDNAIAPYYITKERRSIRDYTQDIVFYFTDEQDKMVFTICFGEIFT